MLGDSLFSMLGLVTIKKTQRRMSPQRAKMGHVYCSLLTVMAKYVAWSIFEFNSHGIICLQMDGRRMFTNAHIYRALINWFLDLIRTQILPSGIVPLSGIMGIFSLLTISFI